MVAVVQLVEHQARVSFGVADGARTRDTQDHNLVLYQLNECMNAHQTQR